MGAIRSANLSWTKGVIYTGPPVVEVLGPMEPSSRYLTLVLDARGTLYGASLWGGTNGHGTVYKLSR